MVEIIERKIKEEFGNKAAFCESQEYKYKDFGSKLRTVNTKISWLNTFLKPLKLKIKITDIDE